METIKIQNKRTGEIDELVVPQGMKPDEFKNQVLNKTFTGSIQKVRSEKKPVESQNSYHHLKLLSQTLVWRRYSEKVSSKS